MGEPPGLLVFGPLISVVVLALTAAVGGRAEREGAAVGVVVLLSSLGLQLAGAGLELSVAIADVLLLGGAILLAFRHRRMWLFAEIAVGLALVGAHVLNVDNSDPTPSFRVLIDTLALGALAILMVSGLRTFRGKRVAAATP